jgi:hypothetical protein
VQIRVQMHFNFLFLGINFLSPHEKIFIQTNTNQGDAGQTVSFSYIPLIDIQAVYIPAKKQPRHR